MSFAGLRLPEILNRHQDALTTEWLKELDTRGLRGDSRIGESQLRKQAEEFVSLLRAATSTSRTADRAKPEWQAMENFLQGISESRVQQGFTSGETARFIFSFKRPLFSRMRSELKSDPEALADEIWQVTELLDELGMWTVAAFQKNREEVIQRQQAEMLELSTPVVKLWEGVLALPMIGTLDSNRTQIVMESLLQRIVETGSELAIIDITGVPTVDTLVAQHLLKTVTAIRLMGADCIISGIRPQIAQTIVHLGVDLQGVTTKASLADALALALKRNGYVISKVRVSN